MSTDDQRWAGTLHIRTVGEVQEVLKRSSSEYARARNEAALLDPNRSEFFLMREIQELCKAANNAAAKNLSMRPGASVDQSLVIP
jgi:hypothetical protein